MNFHFFFFFKFKPTLINSEFSKTDILDRKSQLSFLKHAQDSTYTLHKK